MPESDTGMQRSAEFTGLARMMSLECETPALWPPSDLSEILSHQLRSSLLFDLEKFGSLDPARLAEARELMTDADLTTFGGILRHPNPPLELLRLIKDFGKAAAARSDGPVPREVGCMLYYAAIVTALSRHGVRLTSMDDADLTKCLVWASRESWIDTFLRDLFDKTLDSAKDGRISRGGT